MVCVPCIVIPFCLWVFHRFIRPFLLKIWNPWATQKKVVAVSGDNKSSTKTSVDLETKFQNGKINTDKNNENGIAESKKMCPSESVINTKTCGDSALQHLQEECVTDKKRD